AVFGVLFACLFTKQSMGLNMLAFVILIYGFAFFNKTLFINKTFLQEPVIYLFCVPALFLGVCLFTGSTELNALAVLVILLALSVQFLVLSDNALHRWDEPGFLLDLFFGGLNRLLLSIGFFITGTVNNVFKKQSEKKRGAVIGVFIGLVLLILIIPILMLADANVTRIVDGLFEGIDFGDVFLYIFVFFVGASLITGPVATANRGEFTGKRTVRASAGKRPFEGVTTGVAFSMIGVVYILFAAVQFGYFFEPKETIASVLGLTSSAYAVRGFGELLFITCLNFVIIAAAMRFTAQKDGKTQMYLKVLYTVLIVFNFVIMASSHLRMQCYEAAFGYTVARFLSHSFMVLLLILNAVMLVRIFLGKVKTVRLFIIAALVYFCTIVAINPELYVAKRNIQRYEETGKIDTVYLFTLTGDAVSEACDFVTAHPEEFDETAQKKAERRLGAYESAYNGNWQSLNIADRRAYVKLGQLLE
ncbi:MAG: DUF4173 domain-containing protein, partial [Eubacteriales bacterium]|nr:DUF4173 domain-containing protein [Eubacteriales bacterium]